VGRNTNRVDTLKSRTNGNRGKRKSRRCEMITETGQPISQRRMVDTQAELSPRTSDLGGEPRDRLECQIRFCQSAFVNRIAEQLRDSEATTDLLEKSDSSKPPELKTSWTWEEWLASRAARRAASLRVGPPVTRRKESSSDRRLRAAFDGQRAPKL